MELKTILVHIGGDKGNTTRLAHAISLAKENTAHLVGIYAHPQLRMPSHSGAFVPAELASVFAKNARKQLERLSREFEDATQRADIVGEWRCAEGSAARVINMHARYADLVIVGQEENYLAWLDDSVTEHVALGSGRPTVVVPMTPTLSQSGRRICVAWDGSREAVRAVYDSMPLLEQAEEVTVITVNAKTSSEGHGEEPSADICKQLARHGVTATGKPVKAGPLSVGQTIHRYVTDEAFDLVVMGAYGHSRLRELVLGGTTQYFLKNMTVPVLLSH